jgi:hypothetical protein
MNPVKQIGRYEIPIASIVAIVTLPDGQYEVILPYNTRLIFTAEEKRQLDKARDEHALICQVWGMAKSAGLRA